MSQQHRTVAQADLVASLQVSSKLVVETPSKELVDAYLREIAKGYGVEWEPASSESKTDDGDGGDGGVKVRISSFPFSLFHVFSFIVTPVPFS